VRAESNAEARSTSGPIDVILGSSIRGFVYLDAAPPCDRQRFVLALPKIKAHGMAPKAHGVLLCVTILTDSFVHHCPTCALVFSIFQNAYGRGYPERDVVFGRARVGRILPPSISSRSIRRGSCRGHEAGNRRGYPTVQNYDSRPKNPVRTKR